MKNFKFLLLAIAFIGFVSCSNDDSTEDQIEGQWTIFDASIDSETTITANRMTTVIDQVGKYKEGDYYITFSNDGTYTNGGNLVLDVDNYTNGDLISTEEIDYSELGIDNMTQGVWSIVNDKIIIDGESDQNIRIDGDQLIMSVEDDIAISDEMSIDMNIEFVFTKQ